MEHEPTACERARPRPRRRWSRTRPWSGLVAVGVAAVVGVGVVATWGSAEGAVEAGAAPTTTAEHRDLTASVAVDGQLESTDTRAVYWQQEVPPPSSSTGSTGDTQTGAAGTAPSSGRSEGTPPTLDHPPAPPPPADDGRGGGGGSPPSTPPSTSPGTTDPPPPSTDPTTPCPTTPPSTTDPTSSTSTTGPADPCGTSSSSSTTTTTPTSTTSATSPEQGWTGQSTPTPTTTRPDDATSDSASGTASATGSTTTTGTVTAVVGAGSEVQAGQVLFRIDGRPTVLMAGEEVTYRDLGAGVADGPDVAQLEQNLTALGFTDDGELTVDQHFDADTTAAVEAWQESLGVEATGVVTYGDVLFLPAPVRVAAVEVAVGDTVEPGVHVLDVTAETLVAVGNLPVAQQAEVAEGSAVTLTLADRSTAGGTVLAVGGDATRPEDGAVTESTVEVQVQLDGTTSATARDEAAVALAIATESRDDVLSVPVAAIVDGGDGSPAVLTPGGDRFRLVDVETGLAAGGYVEVTGGSLAQGDEIALPGDEPSGPVDRLDGDT